jgi:hypothetical protein
MMNLASFIETHPWRQCTLRTTRPNLRWYAILALLGWCAGGSELIAQQPSPKSAGASTTKASQPPAIPATAVGTQASSLKRQIERLTKNRDSLLVERRDLQHLILDQCGLSPENAKPLLLSLERDRFNLRISLEPERVYVRILTQRLAEFAEQAKKRIESDRVTEGLKKIVAARRAMNEKLRAHVASGQVAQFEVDKADAELAEAEVRLALREEEIAKSQGDSELERQNRQLRERANEMSFKEARLKELDHSLSSLQGVLDMVDRYDLVNERLKAVDADILEREQGLRLSED